MLIKNKSHFHGDGVQLAVLRETDKYRYVGRVGQANWLRNSAGINPLRGIELLGYYKIYGVNS